jgi:hypothetical protein
VTWRVRPWIRAAAVGGYLLLAAQQVVVYRTGPRREVRDGWVVLAGYVLLVWLLAFRPYLRIDGDDVVVRNPLRRTRFRRADVTGWTFTGTGLAFFLRDGRAVTTIVFQNTRAAAAVPRWHGAVEAVTGRPPD